MSPWVVEKWNSYDTMSSLPPMKHTWSFFVTFEIESIAHQMVLSSHSMVFISLPKAFEFAFFFILLLKRLMWSFGYG